MRRIETMADIERGLEALVEADPRLAAVVARAGSVPLRLSPPGFASLAAIVVSQQVSRASADAIFGRLERLVSPLDAENLLRAGQPAMVEAGLSRPKQRALAAIATAVLEDGFDLEGLCHLEPHAAMARLRAIPGIGPWTAEIYLLFAAGHPDIFPARDLALQSSVGQAFAMEKRPDHATLARRAEAWAPWRGVAARLFWAYYAVIKGREGAPARPAGAKKRAKSAI